MDNEGIRGHEHVGTHRVVWLEGLPESVEDFVRTAIHRFPDLVPADAPLVVGWDPEDETSESERPFATRWIGDEEGYRLLAVRSVWWDRDDERREYDFVMQMLIEGFARSGELVHDPDVGLRLKVADRALTGNGAVGFLNDLATRLIAER